MIVFGVACFNFGVKVSLTGEINSSIYAALLEKSLYESDYVVRSSVVIDYDNSLDFSIKKDDPIEPLGDGGGFPLPPFFSLQFSISIPKHVQEEIGREMGMSFDIQKTIHITIVDAFHGPITFVSYESDLNDNGAWAVILVRKYLEKHYKEKQVYFEFIGPSPFHANFSIAPATETPQTSGLDENGFSIRKIPVKGYDRVCFLYSPKKYKTDEEAFENLIHSLDNELDFFYLFNKLRVERMRKWEEIDCLYEELMESTNKSNWFSRIIFATDGRQTDQLLRRLTDFEIMDFDHAARLMKNFETTYSKGTPTYLEMIIEKEYRMKTKNYPTKQIIYFLEFHEKRFLHVWQTSLLASSALVGALIGSIVTALIS